MEIGIRDLRDRLFEYLRRAEAGEEILVIFQGRAIVRMTGIEQTPAEETEADVIACLRANPHIRAGSGDRVGPVSCPIPATPTREPLLSDLLLEDRK
ncbi:MAG: hypothetical protein LGR52_13505 [Candidatus Thiosymbion ectosymbiont of Robbea hypermnestra]|nr:hypothetical protein [Candidatus Thiosymbion ectosymbiont of Robbea hypermnestra]